VTDSAPSPSPEAIPPDGLPRRLETGLPIASAPRSPRRALLVQTFRALLLLSIIWLIHDQHRTDQAEQAGRDAAAVALDTILPYFPTAANIGEWSARRGGRIVTDAQDQQLGYFVQTAPTTDDILGYSGPTNTLIAFNTEDQVTGVTVLSSGDTREHVADVLRDEQFLATFTGKTWTEVAQMPDPDGVTGATLTSMAIAEGIRRRLGGTRPSLRFPAAAGLPDLATTLPTAATLEPRRDYPQITDVLDDQGSRIGAFLRTTPSADAVHGYQGPTDTLVILDPNDRIIALVIRNSFDNEPYVTYVRDDGYFPTLFIGQTLAELAAFDLEEAEVEGVSGATMTSVSIAGTLPLAARSALTPPAEPASILQWKLRDTGTTLVVITACLLCFTRLRRLRYARVAFLVLLIGYLGFFNGDLVSQTLLVGWSRSGVPWETAPGLALLTVSALLIPLFTKRNIYCSHLCPFGASQQLVRKAPVPRLRLAPWVTRVLGGVPAILLGCVVATAMGHLAINLAALEPFDAFIFRVAGWASIAIAITGFVAAFFMPMAYCRFGCPTGALLQFLRLHARSDRIGTRDMVAIALLLLALSLRLL